MMSLERKTQWNHFNLLGSLIGFTGGSLKSTETEWFVKSRKQCARERKKVNATNGENLRPTQRNAAARHEKKKKKRKSALEVEIVKTAAIRIWKNESNQNEACRFFINQSWRGRQKMIESVDKWWNKQANTFHKQELRFNFQLFDQVETLFY